MKLLIILLSLCFQLSLVTINTADARSYQFSGGPSGGTFLYYANGISSIARKAGYSVAVKPSNGSVENIYSVDSGKTDFALAYSGSIFHARQGTLKNDSGIHMDIMALGYLYGAPLQLVVRKDSGINSIKDLVGKCVAVGNAGSGAALSSEILFRQLELWNKIDARFIGYNTASRALQNHKIDAFLVIQGYPGAAIAALANKVDIRVLDVLEVAKSSGLFQLYPYYTPATIPAMTYQNQHQVVKTFQEQTILIANKSVPADVVYQLLKDVYSSEGINALTKSHRSAKGMNPQDGLKGIVTPLHPGAIIFWKEIGVMK